jgi:hypothetical protein
MNRRPATETACKPTQRFRPSDVLGRKGDDIEKKMKSLYHENTRLRRLGFGGAGENTKEVEFV